MFCRLLFCQPRVSGCIFFTWMFGPLSTASVQDQRGQLWNSSSYVFPGLSSQASPPDLLIYLTQDNPRKYNTGNRMAIRSWLSKNIHTMNRWHCQAYPNCIELSNSNDLICESRSLAMHIFAGMIFLCLSTMPKLFILMSVPDGITSPYANLPHNMADFDEILTRIDSLKG